MKEIASIKSILDQTLSSSALKDNEFNENENENKNNSAEKIQKLFRGNKARQQTELIKKEKINKAAVNIQKVFRGSKARQETEQMKNDVKNESSEEENTDEPDENKSVTKNQKGKGLPVRRIKKGSRKGN
jgi:hypothetical protein